MPIESGDLIKGAITGALGLAGTLLSIGFSWIKDRDAEAQKLRLLDASTKRIQFWDSWLKIQLSTELSEPQKQFAFQEVRNQTQKLRDIVGKAFGLAEQLAYQAALDRNVFDERRKQLSRFRRFLLLYKPARFAAWIPRVLFWVLILTILVANLNVLSVPVLGILLVPILLLVSWAFWAISRAIERPRITPNIY